MTESKTAPEVPHADLIARLRMVNDNLEQNTLGIRLDVVDVAAEALAALGDTVPREEHEEVSRNLVWNLRWKEQAQAETLVAERERDEARAERDLLVMQRDGVLAAAVGWDEAFNDPFTIGTHPYTREVRHIYNVPAQDDAAPRPITLLEHDAEVKAQALEKAADSLLGGFEDGTHEWLYSRAAAIREEAK